MNRRDIWSGRVDSNHRPPGPEPGALARLSHAPNFTSVICCTPCTQARYHRIRERRAQTPRSCLPSTKCSNGSAPRLADYPARHRRRRDPPRARRACAPRSPPDAPPASPSRPASSAPSPTSNGPPSAASSTPPASSSTPISDARRSARHRPCPGYSNLEYDLAAGTPRQARRPPHRPARTAHRRARASPSTTTPPRSSSRSTNSPPAAKSSSPAANSSRSATASASPTSWPAPAPSSAKSAPPTARIIDDYRAAITDRTRLLLRVHPSNFRISGFTARPELRELAALGRERGIPVYEDLGSGCVADLRAFGIDEPLVSDSLAAGADLVSFSGDKLLGGPQAGILAGKAGDRRAPAPQSAVPRPARR